MILRQLIEEMGFRIHTDGKLRAYRLHEDTTYGHPGILPPNPASYVNDRSVLDTRLNSHVVFHDIVPGRAVFSLKKSKNYLFYFVIWRYDPLKDWNIKDIRRLTYQEFAAACKFNAELRKRLDLQNAQYEDKVEFTPLHTINRIQRRDA